MKTCVECGVKKPLTDFNVCRTHKDGHRSRCKICGRTQAKAYYWLDPVERKNKKDLKERAARRLKNLGVRTCSKCGVEQKLTEFHVMPKRKDGYNTQCKICVRVVDNAHYWSNPERANKKRVKQRQQKQGVKTCSKCGIEKVLADFNFDCTRKDTRYPQCKVCFRISMKKYYGTSKGRVAGRRGIRKYRATKLNVTIGPIDEAAIFAQCENKCTYCGSEENLSLDHIVALAAGGPHIQSNLTVACQSCNSSKGKKPLNEWLTTQKTNKSRNRLQRKAG